jgi:hypothetical protein
MGVCLDRWAPILILGSKNKSAICQLPLLRPAFPLVICLLLKISSRSLEIMVQLDQNEIRNLAHFGITIVYVETFLIASFEILGVEYEFDATGMVFLDIHRMAKRVAENVANKIRQNIIDRNVAEMTCAV